MKKNFLLFCLSVISLIQINCTGSIYDFWLLEWRFLNLADTTASIKTPKHEIEVQYKLPTDVSGKLDSNGQFLAQIGVEGEEKDIDEFPSTAKLHVKLSYDTLVAFDSVFVLDELDFKLGYSSLYKTNQNHVSNKTFYIHVP